MPRGRRLASQQPSRYSRHVRGYARAAGRTARSRTARGCAAHVQRRCTCLTPSGGGCHKRAAERKRACERVVRAQRAPTCAQVRCFGCVDGRRRRRSLLLPQQSVQSASRGRQRSDCAGSRRRGACAADSAVCAPLLTPAIFVALAACRVCVAAGRLLEVSAAAHHSRHGPGHQLGALAAAHANAAR